MHQNHETHENRPTIRPTISGARTHAFSKATGAARREMGADGPEHSVPDSQNIHRVGGLTAHMSCSRAALPVRVDL